MKDFAALDFETANECRSSVGVVIVRGGKIVDTFYSLIHPELENHQLQTAAAACDYDLTNHHHALADAEACVYIAMKLL